MAKVGAQRAAELTGKSKSTIQRAMKNGKISFEKDKSGRRVIDVSELDRAFGLAPEQKKNDDRVVEQELEKASAMIEAERMKMRIKMLEQQVDTANEYIDDLKTQRDQWQQQASQVLLTSEYSQRQAEEFREELKERDRKIEERRKQRMEQQKLEAQMQKMKAQNQNAGAAKEKDDGKGIASGSTSNTGASNESKTPGSKGEDAKKAISKKLADQKSFQDAVKEEVGEETSGGFMGGFLKKVKRA